MLVLELLVVREVVCDDVEELDVVLVTLDVEYPVLEVVADDAELAVELEDVVTVRLLDVVAVDDVVCEELVIDDDVALLVLVELDDEVTVVVVVVIEVVVEVVLSKTTTP